MINNKTHPIKWVTNHLFAVDCSYRANGSRAGSGRESRERRTGWTDKLMGGYGLEKSGKDKEEKDTHFGTAVDCRWLSSNFGRFDSGKREGRMSGKGARWGQAEFTFEHGFRDRTKRGYEKELYSLSTEGTVRILRVRIFCSRGCARSLKLATRSRGGSEEVLLSVSRNPIHGNGYGRLKIF